jgi:hypothetical protein
MPQLDQSAISTKVKHNGALGILAEVCSWLNKVGDELLPKIEHRDKI